MRTPITVAAATRSSKWNVAVLVFLGLIVAMIIGTTPEKARDREARVSHARARLLVGVIVTSVSSLTMVALILRDMERHQPGFRTQINLCVAAVFSAWFLLQTMFALFYARKYWQPATGPGNKACAGGLDFPDEACPRLLGFSLLLVHAGNDLRDVRRADSKPDATARGPAAAILLYIFYYYYRAGHQRDQHFALAHCYCGPVLPN